MSVKNNSLSMQMKRQQLSPYQHLLMWKGLHCKYLPRGINPRYWSETSVKHRLSMAVLCGPWQSMCQCLGWSWVGGSQTCVVIIGMLENTVSEQNGWYFADGTFRYIYSKEIYFILIKISWNCVLVGPTDNKPALDQIMASYRTGHRLLLEPMMAYFTDECMHHLDSVTYYIIIQCVYAHTWWNHYIIHYWETVVPPASAWSLESTHHIYFI